MTQPPAGGPRVLDLDDVPGRPVDLVGGKAAGLSLMVDLGLRVPPAFVLTTEVWRSLEPGAELPADVLAELDAAVARLEARTGRVLGDPDRPLLVSVRSGAPVSMPGMMDTILDVGRPPVDDARRRLRDAISEVLASWDSERARTYRDHHGLGHHLGTAVVVQAMVFGNQGPHSGAGVASSRDPDTGAPVLRGDYRADAPGDEVVDGRHVTESLEALAEREPAVAAELATGVAAIEAGLRDAVEVEFTIEHGTLHYLQCRVARRAAPAAVRIAVDLVDEGVIGVDEALGRVSTAQLARAAQPTIDLAAGAPVAIGTGACPGVATGAVCLSSERVDAVARDGGPVVLLRPETSPADLPGMLVASGLLTSTGGLVSHAALVARELDLPTVVGVAELVVDDRAGTARLGGVPIAEGDVLTIDGGTGAVHLGAVPIVDPAGDERLTRFRGWLDASGRPRPG